MALFNLPNASTGVDSGVKSIAQSVSILPIMIILLVYFAVLLGGTNNQKRRTGRADYPFWNLLACITSFFLCLIFTLGVGIIDNTTLGIVIAITIL